MVIRNAHLSDLAVAKVRRFCDQRVPATAWGGVCLEVTTRVATISIGERRPLCQGGPGAWTRMPIAQRRYDTAASTWSLYWADRNRRWHRYDDLDPTPQLEDLLKEIDEDPISILCNSPTWPLGYHLLQTGAYGGSVAAGLEMSLQLGGCKAAARCGAARLRPTVVSLKTSKEDTMATTLLDYRAKMAELRIDDLLREAAAARKVQAARAARRPRGV